MDTITAASSSIQTVNPPAPRKRIEGIDILRGLVMVIMALDHTRDLIHSQAFTGDPLNMFTTTPVLFFTRWITHFCAPVFVFLSGTSAYLQSLRKDKSTLSLFLIKRGLWLIVAEVVIVTLGISFDITYSTIALQVIWAIGISMVLLGFAVRLPFSIILAIGLIIVVGHNTLDYYESGHSGSFPLWYDFLHHQTMAPLWNGHSLLIFYPFLPWTGLMFLGYCFGKVYKSTDLSRIKRSTVGIGLSLILLFIILRGMNSYGDPDHWAVQKNALYTFMSFVNTHKYPPSLLYMCMTIGPSLVFLGLLGNLRTRAGNFFSVYGRVPFFYYILHFYLIHFISATLFLMRGHTIAEGMKDTLSVGFCFLLPGEGYPLRIVYLIWIGVVLLLYPVCRWYGRYKRQHSHWWLSYL